MPRPHLLYVAWGFPPCRGAGVYRALATANAFADAGWDVTVLTAPRELFEDYYGSDPSLERLVHPSIRVRRVAQQMPLMEFDLARYPRTRVISEPAWSSAARRLQTLPFPERSYGPWRRNLESATLRVHREHAVDLVVGTSNPHIDFLPGRLLHRRFGVPYVMDYRDAWALNVETDARDYAPDSRTWRIEHSLLKDAAEVWFVNEPIRKWYEDAAPEIVGRTRVVMNGYDGDAGAEVEQVRREAGRAVVPDPDAPLTFGFIGSIYGATPLAETLAGWRRARELSPELARARLVLRGHLGHYGVPEDSFVTELALYSSDGVEYGGPVSRSDVGPTYADFDVLALPLRGGRYVTSGKVFEYASTGLPVVSIHSTELHATAVMRSSPAWVICASMSPDDVAAALIEGADIARSSSPGSVAATRAWAAQYARDIQLAPRVEAMTALVSDGSSDETATAPLGQTAALATDPSAAMRPESNRGVDGRRGPQGRVVLLVGSDVPADQILERTTGPGDLSARLGPTGHPAHVTLICRRAPSKAVDGVAAVHVVADDSSVLARVARSDGYRSVETQLQGSVPGRVLVSLSPTDETRTFHRAVSRDPIAMSLAQDTDLAVAVDRPAVRTAWLWLRQRRVPAAVFGTSAAERRARR